MADLLRAADITSCHREEECDDYRNVSGPQQPSKGYKQEWVQRRVYDHDRKSLPTMDLINHIAVAYAMLSYQLAYLC